jgi:hypothetical protein
MSELGRSAFIPPCIPTLVDKPPVGEAWTHEIKYDGYRTQIHMAGAEARAFTRNGYDWSMKYLAVLAGARALIRRDTATLDGEMVVQDETGRSDFKRLVSAIRWESASSCFTPSICLASTVRSCCGKAARTDAPGCSVEDALEFLYEWPKHRRGPIYETALRACQRAFDGNYPLHAARQAFCGFAKSVNILEDVCVPLPWMTGEKTGSSGLGA